MSGSRWLPFIVLMAGPMVFGHDIITTKLTYARDVRPMLAERCLACHSPSSKIPLTTYEEVRPWAVDIKEQVLSRAMPPWGAAKGFRALDPDDSLTEDELTIIAAWVIGGAPAGDLSHLARSASRGEQVSEVPLTMLPIQNRATLTAPADVVGIVPLTAALVDSAKITAQLPDGRVEPLLWLTQYDGASKRSFRFRDALLLPAGTVVTSCVPLRFALQKRTGLPSLRR